MKYGTGETMTVGDQVLVRGMTGIIVCDFDSWCFAAGHESWEMPPSTMPDGTSLSSGVIINTEEAGLVYYGSKPSEIRLLRAAGT